MYPRVLTSIAAALLCAAAVRADNKLPAQLEGIGIDEKLGAKVDLDLQFTAENGYQVPLRSFFSENKPVLLNLVYYTCPMLCNLVLNGQTQAIRDVAWTPGDQYHVVTISIDPRDTFAIAAKKKQAYMESFGRPVNGGWHFLTDFQGNVKKLADQVGFKYRWDQDTEQFAHAAAIMFLTPDGRVSRYLYGVKFNPRDVRLALTEASEGKMGSTIDRILLFCYHYDPSSRSYVPFAMNMMRAGGALTVVILAFTILRFRRGERRRAAQSGDSSLVIAK